MLADIAAHRLRGRRAQRRACGPATRRRRRRRPDRPGRDHDRAGCSAPPTIVAVDLADSRLEAAKRFGADVIVDAHGRTRWRSCASSPTGWAPTSPSRRSASPRPSSCAPRWSAPAAAWPTSACTASRRRLHLEDLWIKDVTITTGLVDTYSTPTLLRLLAERPAGRRAGSSPTGSPWTR